MKSSIRTAFLLFFSFVIFLQPSVQAQGLSEFLFGQTVKKNQKATLDKRSPAYLDSLVAHTPLEETVGQLFFIPAEGAFTPKDRRKFKQL